MDVVLLYSVTFVLSWMTCKVSVPAASVYKFAYLNAMGELRLCLWCDLGVDERQSKVVCGSHVARYVNSYTCTTLSQLAGS